MNLMIYDHALLSCCILTMFHAFRCMFDYVEMYAGRFGLGFTHDVFIFAHHMFMHISCIRILSFLSFCFCLWCVFSLSPFLSRIDYTWHPRANIPRLGTLLVLGLPLLLIHPFFMFGSVMGRPNRTSLRTFRDMAFIQCAMSFCRTFSTFLYPMSFGLGDGNLFVRFPWGALSCLYRSFTLIYMVLIPLYLNLPQHSKVHVS